MVNGEGKSIVSALKEATRKLIEVAEDESKIRGEGNSDLAST